VRAKRARGRRRFATIVAGMLVVTLLPVNAAPAAPSVVSDGFEGGGLGSVWSFVDPVGDSAVSVSGGRLEISVPGGTSHNLWTGANRAPRVLQAAPDADFELVAKFDSLVSAKYQMQGLLAVADLNNLVRVDVEHDGSSTRVFAAWMVNGSASTRINKVIPGGAPVWLRLVRSGDTWTVSHSRDGSAWTTAGSFTHALTVSQVGVWAGNHTPSPAFTAQVDYFLNPADPLEPPPSDTSPPVVSGVDVSAGVGGATVSWSTDEPATSGVVSGVTTAYENGLVSDPALTTTHSLTVPGLECATTYHYQVSSADAAGNVAVTPDATFTTADCGSSTGPVIDVWYGLNQRFGHLANSQIWITIPGTVTSSEGIDDVVYRLNGGVSQPLSLGPDTRRLAEPGDFIIELDRASLPSGLNEVEVIATDLSGGAASVTVNLEHTKGKTGPLPMTIGWAGVSDLLEVVEPMEGRWAVSGSTVGPTQFEYDRLLALGDINWTNYEISVPVTMNEIDPVGTGFQFPSNGPVLGFGIRWLGHQGSLQPRRDWWPSGAFAWYKIHPNGFQQFELIGNQSKYIDRAPGSYRFTEGQTFIYKARVETGANGRSTYRFKAWNSAATEPVDWLLEITTDASDPTHGSILLIAHEIDASFGTVTLEPLP
jgi:regulation of enolase protein 1 (concanavalin A-like superfamily)